MTLGDFINHLTAQGCTVQPIEDGNASGTLFRLYNPKTKVTHPFAIIGSNVSQKTSDRICSKLGITPP